MSRKHSRHTHKRTRKQASSNIAVARSLPYDVFCSLVEAWVPASELDRLAREVKKIEAATPVYAALPPSLSSFASDVLFLAARSYGRLSFHDDLYIYDETTSSRIYHPEPFTRDEVCEVVKDLVGGVSDEVFSQALPLSWRAGFVHGWLSSLLISQPREASIGLAALTFYVAPLLLLPGRPAVAQLPSIIDRPTA